MILSKRYKSNFNANPERKRAFEHKIVRDFQWKYTGFLLASVLGTLILFLGVSLWHQIDNYIIFKKLAFDTQPELITHLEREMTWLAIFMAVTIVTIGLFIFTIGMRMTKNMTKPLYQMERHMKKVIRGDWSSPDFQYNQNDDLVDFLSTYAYLYRTLRALNESDIKKLEKIVIDPNDRESLLIWNQLRNTKKLQLKLKIEKPKSTNDVETEAKIELRRVS